MYIIVHIEIIIISGYYIKTSARACFVVGIWRNISRPKACFIIIVTSTNRLEHWIVLVISVEPHLSGMEHPDAVMPGLASDLASINDPELQRRLRLAVCSLLLSGGFSGIGDCLKFKTVASAQSASQIAADTPYEGPLKSLERGTELILMRSKHLEEMTELYNIAKATEDTLTSMDKGRQV